MGPTDTTASGSLHLAGVVHGGQNGVAGASIGLYAAGSAGLGSQANNILISPVTTDKFGSFGLTGDYHCVNSTDQMYLTATGGDPGFGSTNPAIVMLAALGDCGNLSSSTYITLNEVTTVAAAWAIGQFATDYAHIGATSTNATGLRNAFLDAKLIADSSYGTTATLPSNLSTEAGKIYALADAIAPCINSTGSVSSGSPCGKLYAAATPAGGTAPSNTFNAALDIVHNPGNNVTDVWGLIDANAPFPTTLTAAPNDWTLSLTVTGGGVALPEELAVDAQGNVWVADRGGAFSGFTPQGTAMSPSAGFGVGVVGLAFGIAIDPSGDIWITNQSTPSHSGTRGSVSKFHGVSTGTAGSLIGTYYDSSLNYVDALFADTNGYIDLANNAGVITVYNNSGGLVASNLGSNTVTFPIAVLPDANHGVWVANDSSSNVTHVALDGTILGDYDCCGDPSGLAGDRAGNVWVANYGSNTVSELTATGTIAINQGGGSDINSPNSIAVDGAQNVWLANYYGSNISEVAGAFSSAPGTGLSPASGLGLDANLVNPFWVLPDASGNVWVSSTGNARLVVFWGLAAPTKTPVQPFAAAP